MLASQLLWMLARHKRRCGFKSHNFSLFFNLINRKATIMKHLVKELQEVLDAENPKMFASDHSHATECSLTVSTHNGVLFIDIDGSSSYNHHDKEPDNQE